MTALPCSACPPDLGVEQRAALVDTTIETLGLQAVRDQPIHQLSGGQRKRVSIGAELLVRPGVLFLDEPTAGIDPGVEERLMRHFRSMADHGTTVVLTTHLLASLALLDKVAIMARGRLVYFGPPTEAPVFFGCPTMARIFDLLGDADERSCGPVGASAVRFAERYRCSSLAVAQVDSRLSTEALRLRRSISDKPTLIAAVPPPRLLARAAAARWPLPAPGSCSRAVTCRSAAARRNGCSSSYSSRRCSPWSPCPSRLKDRRSMPRSEPCRKNCGQAWPVAVRRSGVS